MKFENCTTQMVKNGKTPKNLKKLKDRLLFINIISLFYVGLLMQVECLGQKNTNAIREFMQENSQFKISVSILVDSTRFDVQPQKVLELSVVDSTFSKHGKCLVIYDDGTLIYGNYSNGKKNKSWIQYTNYRLKSKDKKRYRYNYQDGYFITYWSSKHKNKMKNNTKNNKKNKKKILEELPPLNW